MAGARVVAVASRVAYLQAHHHIAGAFFTVVANLAKDWQTLFIGEDVDMLKVEALEKEGTENSQVPSMHMETIN